MAKKPKRLKRNSPYDGQRIKDLDMSFRRTMKVSVMGMLMAVTLGSSLFTVEVPTIEKETSYESVNIQEIDSYQMDALRRAALEEVMHASTVHYGMPELEYDDEFDEMLEVASEAATEIEEEVESEEERLIKLYSDIYELQYDKVYAKLAEMTNDFTDEAYLNNYVIGESKMKNRYVECSSKEMAILIAVRGMYQLPNNYGFAEGELASGVEYNSRLDYSHQIAYVSNVLGVDPVLNYAICKAESNFESKIFLNKNNPSGLRFSSDGWAELPSSVAGFIEQACELLKYQIDGVTEIAEIGAKHAPVDDPDNSNWVRNVTLIYEDALENYEELFGSSEEKVATLH